MPKKSYAWYRFVRWSVRHIVLRALSGGLRVIGKENVPNEGPVILAPNHVSFFDPPVVSCASPRVVCFLAKEELFKPPVFGPLIRSLNAFPVKRGHGDTSAIRTALEKLKGGECLIMFPEGTRGDGKTLLPMQSGVAMLAKKSGACVVPVGVYGTHRMLPKGRSLPKFSRLTVVFGTPIHYDQSKEDKLARTEFNEALAKQLVEVCRKAGLDVKAAPEA